MNYFNEYFVNIGRTLGSKRDDVELNTHQQYFKNPTSNLFSFQVVTEDTISKILDNVIFLTKTVQV